MGAGSKGDAPRHGSWGLGCRRARDEGEAGREVCLGMSFMSLQMMKKRRGIGQGIEGRQTQLSGKKRATQGVALLSDETDSWIRDDPPGWLLH